MFGNYLMAALRNLARNRLYAGINIVGLAVGFAAAILIALYVRDELTFDRFIPDAAHIYNVYTVFPQSGRTPLVIDRTAGDLAAAFRLDFPALPALGRHLGPPCALRAGVASPICTEGSHFCGVKVWVDFPNTLRRI